MTQPTTKRPQPTRLFGADNSLTNLVRQSTCFLQAVEDRPRLLGLLLSLAYLVSVMGAGTRPLWFDELLGLAAAQAPHWGDVVPVLRSGVDFNPPFYHFVTRAFIVLLGESELSVRLPAIFGMLCFLICLYVFALRRMRPVFASLAFALPLAMPMVRYGREARPYGLLLGLTGIALLAYDGSVRSGKRGRALFALALALGAAPWTHYYGLLLVVPFAVAEVVRGVRARRLDAPVALALAAPFGALIPLLGLIRTHRAQLAHYHSPGTWQDLLNGFSLFAIPPAICIAALLVALLLTQLEDISTGGCMGGRHCVIAPHDWALIMCFAALPFLGVILAKTITHAFVDRYFLGATAGISLLLATLIAKAFGNRLLGPYAVLAVLAGCGLSRGLLESYSQLTLSGHAESLKATFSELSRHNFRGLPLVLDDAKDFLYGYRNFPQLRRTVYFLASPENSLRLSGFDTDDRIMLALRGTQALPIEPYSEFTSTHPRFYLYRSQNSVGSTAQALVNSGATLELKSMRSQHGSLYLVTEPALR